MAVPDEGRPVDVLFLCSITVAGNLLVGNTAYPRIVDDFRSTFARLAAMKAEVVLTSHPEIADVLGREARWKPGQPNPFIDPVALTAIVASARENFETALKAAKAAQ
jgi:metallo-beta-lactamase class B